jgi:hypothetical protein
MTRNLKINSIFTSCEGPAEYGKRFAADRLVLIDPKDRIRGYYSLGESDTVSRIAKDAARLESET